MSTRPTAHARHGGVSVNSVSHTGSRRRRPGSFHGSSPRAAASAAFAASDLAVACAAAAIAGSAGRTARVDRASCRAHHSSIARPCRFAPSEISARGVSSSPSSSCIFFRMWSGSTPSATCTERRSSSVNASSEPLP